MSPPLIERYAERLHLTAEEARRRLFYECVPNWKRTFVRFHRLLRPRLYQNDIRLVDEAGKATTYQEVLDAIDRWNHRALPIRSVARDRWNWRVSGRRLVAVSVSLFGGTVTGVVPDGTRSSDTADTAKTPDTDVLKPLPRPLPTAASAIPPSMSRPALREVPDLVRAHG